MRSINHAHRAAAVLAVIVALTAGVAGTAQAAKGGKGGKPGSGSTITTTTTSPATTIANAHTATCPKVMEYTSCSTMAVTISNFGAVGWAGSASPSSNAVSYNSYFSSATQADWNNVVAHEVGGHVDTWNEIVAKVGTTQAWTDYYDLDHFGETWAEARWKALKGTTRDLSSTEGKEAYLDCAGPVAHGFQGNYLYSWGFTGSLQASFCSGSGQVLTDALTKVRP